MLHDSDRVDAAKHLNLLRRIRRALVGDLYSLRKPFVWYIFVSYTSILCNYSARATIYP